MSIHRSSFLAFFGVLGLASILTSAQAQMMPDRKAGLWEIRTAADGVEKSSPAIKMCIDKSTDREMYDWGSKMMQTNCSKRDIKVSGNTLTSESVCSFGPITASSKSVTTLTGDSALRTETVATYDPPMMGKKESRTVTEGRWVGACGNLKPGDMDMGGRVINISELRAMQPTKKQ